MRRQTVRLETTLAQADGRAVRGYGRAASPGFSDCVAARRTDALHEVTVQSQRTRTPERADTDAGHRTVTPDMDNRPWTSHSGHRTPDTGRVDTTE